MSVEKPGMASFVHGRVTLVPLRVEHLALTLLWRNHARVRSNLVTDRIISHNEHMSWFQDYLERDNDYTFIVEETVAFKRPVGQVSIYDIDHSRKIGEFGRLMIGDPCALGLGVGRAASEAAVEFADGVLGLEILRLRVFDTNLPAMRIYRKLGFKVMGRLDQKGLILMERERLPDAPATG